MMKLGRPVSLSVVGSLCVTALLMSCGADAGGADVGGADDILADVQSPPTDAQPSAEVGAADVLGEVDATVEPDAGGGDSLPGDAVEPVDVALADVADIGGPADVVDDAQAGGVSDAAGDAVDTTDATDTSAGLDVPAAPDAADGSAAVDAPDPSDSTDASDVFGADLPDAVDSAGTPDVSVSDGALDAGDADAGLDAADIPPPSPPCDAELVGGRLVHGDGPPLAKIDPACGLLSYGWYSNEGDDAWVQLLPDFSFAGYLGGGVAIPQVPVVETLSPAAGDNHAAIQGAIDAVSALEADANGFRGAILLTQGTYEVGDTLSISAGGVVLRGEGQGTSGTVIVATLDEQHDLIEVTGAGSGLGEVPGTRVDIVSPLVAVGSTSLEVASAANFAVGDRIALLRTPNQAWIDALEMGQWGWTPSSYAIGHEREIVAINGAWLTLDIPVVDAIEAKYGGGVVFTADLSGRIEQVGIEDLRLVSQYQSLTDEQHGWNAVVFARTMNSWVRRVTAVHFGFSAVNLGNESSFNTVEEVAQLDPISQVSGGRRYSFNINDGVGNLFQRCYARDGRHNFVTGSRVTGPNVWLDSLSMKNNSDEGPHHRWSTGLLFDNCMSNIFNAQNRTSSGTGHGWAGAQTLFWNITAFDKICADAPLGAMNWAVGATGAKVESSYSPDEPFGWWESLDAPVLPRSLYLAQLSSRLGPDAVAAVATPAQLNGTIFQQLNSWHGEGLLADHETGTNPACPGISAGQVCCPASCGVCGGTGCGALPGGATQCCSGSISSAGDSCATNAPPCVLD